MARIITIHGTNAGLPEDRGDKWWQKGSPFEQRLQELIEEPIEFYPFHWSGANSERQRRKAGARLAKLIAKEPKPPILVGHSHGGSVAAHALFYLHLKSRGAFSERIRSLITVGTPMLRFKGAWNPIARLHPVAQLALLIVFALLLSWAVDRYYEGDLNFLLLLAGAVAALLGFIYLFIRRSIRRSSVLKRNMFAGALAEKYAALNHSIDEAVLALKTVGRLRLSFMKAKNLRGGVRAILFAGFIIAWFVSNLTLQFDGGSPYAEASAERANELYSVSRGEFDSRNDMIVRLAPGRALIAPGTYQSDQAPQVLGEYGQAQLMTDFRKYIGTPGPEYGRAHVKSDYFVLDYATAYLKRDYAELRDYIAGAGRTDRATYFCWRSRGQCEFHAAALYLTPAARDMLLAATKELAVADAANDFAIPVFVGAAPSLNEETRRIPALTYAQVDPANAKFFFVEMRKGRTPFDEVLRRVGPRAISSGALLSARSLPPPNSNFFASRYYPIIELGDEIIVPRNMGTTYFLQCGAAKALGLNPMIDDESLFLRTVLTQRTDEETTTGYCAQFAFASNGPFEIYRAVFTTLAVKALDVVFHASPIFLGSSNNAWVLALSAIGIMLIAVAAFLALLIGPLVFIEWASAIIAAIAVRNIAASQLRNVVYGNDCYGEEIAAVASSINFGQRHVGTLPTEVEEKISEHSLRYSQAALQKMRELISLSGANLTSPMLADLTASLTWQELIHTAYFDVPEFTEHFAKELARTSGLSLRHNPPTER